MADVVTIIKASLTGMGVNVAKEFYHGPKSYDNLFMDSTDKTKMVVLLDYPITSKDSIKTSGLIEETYQVTMFFLKKTNLDDTTDQHLTQIKTTWAKANQFLHKLMFDNTDVRTVANSGKTGLINLFDANWSGVQLDFELTPFNRESGCP